jgi:succinate dehydrogenase/fumarate reductase flavoprotein subunit
VIDMQGAVIPGLYCGGESAGGFSQHGLARCVVQGLIAGRNAAAETEAGPARARERALNP